MITTSNFDITSANATGILTVDQLFPAGVELLMFGTDQAAVMDSLDITETRMGVDAHMVAGVVGNIYPLTLTLEAASPSTPALSTVWTSMRNNLVLYECSIAFTVPSIKKVFTWSRGVMKSGVIFPALKRVLDPTTWVFHFEKLDISSY
jgi:hypothetical protein